jgi:uncharacterized protein YegP (UPF0339 family)
VAYLTEATERNPQNRILSTDQRPGMQRRIPDPRRKPARLLPASRRTPMTGKFELFTDNQYFRFRLTAPDGTVMALSRPFPDKAAAVAGIAAVREYAGMGLITDLCPDSPLHQPSANARPAPPTASPLSTAPPPPAGRSAGELPPWTATGTPARPGQETRGRDQDTRGRAPRRPKAA